MHLHCHKEHSAEPYVPGGKLRCPECQRRDICAKMQRTQKPKKKDSKISKSKSLSNLQKPLSPGSKRKRIPKSLGVDMLKMQTSGSRSRSRSNLSLSSEDFDEELDTPSWEELSSLQRAKLMVRAMSQQRTSIIKPGGCYGDGEGNGDAGLDMTGLSLKEVPVAA